MKHIIIECLGIVIICFGVFLFIEKQQIKLFSKRWFVVFLIVTFGFVILENVVNLLFD